MQLRAGVLRCDDTPRPHAGAAYRSHIHGQVRDFTASSMRKPAQARASALLERPAMRRYAFLGGTDESSMRQVYESLRAKAEPEVVLCGVPEQGFL